MAAKSSFSEEDFACPVCHDTFLDPVLLACSHSFCEACLHGWWRQKGTRQCPVCKKTNKSQSPPSNLVLKNLCEVFRRQRPSKRQRTLSEDLCVVHYEELKLFCSECQHPACAECRDSAKHAHHSFRPIEDAASDHKEKIQKTLETLHTKLDNFRELKVFADGTATHIQDQALKTEAQIQQQFEKLHQFLQEEEEARIAALRDEQGQKSLAIMEKIEGLEENISTISLVIRALEEDLKAERISFQQNCRPTMERVLQLPTPDRQAVSGPLIDVAKHLGNLTFTVWDKMKDLVSYNPVILDPNTANPSIALSDDLTTVEAGMVGGQLITIPHNAERFGREEIVI